MAVVFTPIRRVWGYLSPAKPAAPQIAEPATPPSQQAAFAPVEQVEEQKTPRSLFSQEPSDYLPGSKRKFELDFESPKTMKKAKLEAAKMEAELATSKRKRERDLDFDFETPQKKARTRDLSQTMPPMPRSAMKTRLQPTTPATASKKSVTFNQQPLTDFKELRSFYGYAGQYQGSCFLDATPPLSSSPEASPSAPSIISDTTTSQLSMSPATESNTKANTPDTRCRDPYDPLWRPQPHNPRPGEFCLPDDLSDYDDEENESVTEQSTPTQLPANVTGNKATTAETVHKGYNTIFPDSPETPRMSHASLPTTASQSTVASVSEYPTPSQNSFSNPANAGNLFAGVDTDAVNKARAAAEKYKPESFGKQASKLSQVTQARSRSSSPTGSRSATPAVAIDPALVAQDQKTGLVGDDTNNTTTQELEQQLDKWAQNLEWPQLGQKIVEEEVFQSDMMDHILKVWDEVDDEQSEMFWEKEFNRVIEAGRRAERDGKILMFV